MSLFQYTQPEMFEGLRQDTRKAPVVNANGQVLGEEIVSVSLSLAKRKEVAKAYNLQVKGDACSAKLLELSDKMKAATAGEFSKLAASDEWTGAGFSIRKGKNGVMRATAKLVSIDRKSTAPALNDEQVAEYLATKSEGQALKILEDAEARAKAKNSVQVESTVAQAPAA